jgi:hypothetical protein
MILPPEKFVRVNAIQSLRAESRDSAELVISGQEKPMLLGRRAALFLRRAMEEQ